MSTLASKALRSSLWDRSARAAQFSDRPTRGLLWTTARARPALARSKAPDAARSRAVQPDYVAQRESANPLG